jgi:hypothetical protein
VLLTFGEDAGEEGLQNGGDGIEEARPRDEEGRHEVVVHRKSESVVPAWWGGAKEGEPRNPQVELGLLGSLHVTARRVVPQPGEADEVEESDKDAVDDDEQDHREPVPKVLPMVTTTHTSVHFSSHDDTRAHTHTPAHTRTPHTRTPRHTRYQEPQVEAEEWDEEEHDQRQRAHLSAGEAEPVAGAQLGAQAIEHLELLQMRVLQAHQEGQHVEAVVVLWQIVSIVCVCVYVYVLCVCVLCVSCVLCVVCRLSSRAGIDWCRWEVSGLPAR